MQTLSIQIQDDYLQNFMDYVKQNSRHITVTKDKNLEYDPYFYERKRDLEEIIEASENGTMELLSQDQYNQEMKSFFMNLRANENL
jgi:hypothetical protein